MANKFSDFNPASNNTYHNKSMDNDYLQGLINNYSKLSQDELMSEFMKLSAEKKRNGTLNNTEINRIKTTIFPYLNDGQKQMFENLMAGIK